jgi:hypothetical protein
LEERVASVEPGGAQPARAGFLRRDGFLRRYGALLATLLLIKLLVLGNGVRVARATHLDRESYRQNYHHHRVIGRYERPARFDFFELWVAADAQWYLAIADDGYPTRDGFDRGTTSATAAPREIAERDTQIKYAFFPLWPLTMRALTVLGMRAEVAGFLLANALGLVASLVLFGLLERRWDRGVAFGSVVLLFASPFALFFSVPFSESLFLLLAVLATSAVERERFAWAALWIGLAVVTRATGVALLLLPIGWIAAKAWSARRVEPRSARPLAWLALSALAPVAYLAFLWKRTGDPLFFNVVTKGWGGAQGLESPWKNLVHNTWETLRSFDAMPWHAFHRSQLDFLVLVVALVLLAIGARILPLHQWLLAAGLLAIPLLTKDLMSFGRYSVVAWPLACVPVLAVRPEVRRVLVWSLTPLLVIAQMAAAARFVNWEWVG